MQFIIFIFYSNRKSSKTKLNSFTGLISIYQRPGLAVVVAVEVHFVPLFAGGGLFGGPPWGGPPCGGGPGACRSIQIEMELLVRE